jgi:hypothetical protein
MNSRLIWYAIVLIIAIVYLSYYYRYPKEVAILQTTLNDFTLPALLEKQPVVFQDRIQDITEVRKAWFGYNITYNTTLEEGVWVRNRFKHLLIQPETDTELLLYPPHLKMVDGAPDPEEHLVAMQLSAKQLLILPLHWKVYVPAGGHSLRVIGVHDLITMFIW